MVSGAMTVLNICVATYSSGAKWFWTANMVAMVAVGIASVRTTNCWLLNDTPRLAIIPQMSTGKPKFFSSTFKTTMRVSRHGLVVNRSPSANNATPPAACPNSVKFVSQALGNRNPAKFKRKALIGNRLANVAQVSNRPLALTATRSLALVPNSCTGRLTRPIKH